MTTKNWQLLMVIWKSIFEIDVSEIGKKAMIF